MGKLRSWLRSRSSTPFQQRETESESAHPILAPSARQSTSLEQSSAPLFPDGVEILVDPPDADVDIYFVHGLTGNRTSTWTARGQPAPWPKTLLPSELPKACILTYGYDAYVVSKSVASSNRLIDHAMNLLTDLTNDRRRRNASGRPLIFVVHSLGGLVCKEAILLSRNNPNRSRQDFFTHIKGVVFMGTPHKGSWMADWSGIPAKALGLVKSTNRSLLEVLETNNQYLESIHVRFLSMMREQREAGRQLEVACFFEELPLSTVGKVVSKESATFEGYDPITIHANHADMVKFGSAEENGFKRVVGELTAWKPETGKSSGDCEKLKPQFEVARRVDVRPDSPVPSQAREQHVFCYRCDLPSHILPECHALKSTVLRGREEREREGRCINCGRYGHSRPDCEYRQDLLSCRCFSCGRYGHWQRDCEYREDLMLRRGWVH
ncbi:hypothetical protein AU210_016485 [Fusarium oxysporum f. sp. radicis-cucumerinum]|uniref:CCHC-type domain-containing protein n=1 Tax=Fusarium oxysporum f. sp. radicis-cucumerinum TaxID=327505 RepID=A0A2H3G363_FUSOX|nr:hypothetical protein AU210_016485 [Fusarium oxysporum f. sp. radicis-cucumerinum]